MSVSVVVGGQFGSEGKGKVSYYFAKKLGAAAVVRVGGPNSGHTVVGEDGAVYIFRILPTAAIDSSIMCILPSGSYIDIDKLNNDMKESGIKAENLKIDPYAVMINQAMIDAEHQSKLREKIGSTSSGTGAAVIRRLERAENFDFAKNCDKLAPYITDTKKLMRDLINEKEHIVIEGTQGFGLSPLHAKMFPYCTSRDTTASGFVSETGLSPLDIQNVIMVIRTFPIRVAGNSGPLPNEITWEDVAAQCVAGCDLTEYTSATKHIRRVAEFDSDIVKGAIEVNNPNIIVLNHLDYIDYSMHDRTTLSENATGYIANIEKSIGKTINFAGTGKATLVSLEPTL